MSKYVVEPDKLNEYKSHTSKLKKYSTLFSLGKEYENTSIGNKTNLFIHSTYFTDKNIWVIKAPNLNRGRCIKLGDSIQGIQSIIRKFYTGIKKNYSKEDEDDEEENQAKDITKGNIQPNQSNKPVVNNFVGRSKSEKPKLKTNSRRNSTSIGIFYFLTNIINFSEKNNNNGSVGVNSNDYNEESPLKKKESLYRTSTVLLQKYLESPLTYYKRKFDIRVWVLISQDFEVFVFK